MSSIISMIAVGLLAMTSQSIASRLGPAPVNLHTAQQYAILASSGITTDPASSITGNIGVSPIASTAITGFNLILSKSGTFSTSNQVNGKVFAASYVSPTPSKLTTAVLDMQAAYTDAAGRQNPTTVNHAGTTFSPGLHKFTGNLAINADYTLSGRATDTWIFQISGTFAMATGKAITLSGGAQAKNVFWAVAGATTLQAGASFKGTLLAKTSVSMITGAKVVGCVLAQTAVTLQHNTITKSN